MRAAKRLFGDGGLPRAGEPSPCRKAAEAMPRSALLLRRAELLHPHQHLLEFVHRRAHRRIVGVLLAQAA